MNTDLSQSQIKSLIDSKLTTTGEKEKLKDHLRQRLIESGWRDNLKRHVKEVMRERGDQPIVVDELVKTVGGFAKETVPPHVKQEMITQIREFLAKNMD